MSNLKANDFWRPNQSYYAGERLKTLLLHDDKFYVCSEPHLSGSTFDPSKFILVSGGGSGGSLVPAGNWDIANSTTTGPLTELPLLITEFKDSFQYAENSIISGTSHTYPFSGPFYLYGGFSSNTIVNDFSSTKWITMNMAGFNTWMLYDSTGLTTNAAMTDLVQPAFVGASTTITYITAVLGHAFGQTTIALRYNNSIENVSVFEITQTTHPAITNSTYATIGVNLLLGKVYVITDVTSILEFDIPTTVLDAPELTFFAGGVYGSVFGTGITEILNPDPINYPPLTQQRSTTIVLPPEPAIDGTMWKLTSDGVYGTTSLKSDDYVIFFNNLADIVLVANTTAEITSLQTSVDILTAQVTSSFISASDKAKLRGIIDYISQDAPVSPITGKTVLCLSGTSITVNGSYVTAYQIVVYNGTAWEHVSLLQGTVWTHEASGMILYFNNAVHPEIYDYSGSDAGILELLSSSYWHVLDKYTSSSLVLSSTSPDSSDYFYINFDSTRNITLLSGTPTFYVVNITVPSNDRTNIRSQQYSTLSLVNQQSVEVSYQLVGATMSMPFTSTIITLPPYATLVLDICNRGDSTHASFKYGEYKTNHSYLLSEMGTLNWLYNINEVFLWVDINEVLGKEITFYINPFNRSYIFKLNLLVAENLLLTIRIVNENNDVSLATETISLVPGDKFKTLLYTPNTINPIRVY